MNEVKELVEGLNRQFDKTIEEAKKIEQIDGMARDICKLGISCEECTMLARKTNQTREQYCKAFEYAKRAYNADCRKQSEWISVEDRLPNEKEMVLVTQPHPLTMDLPHLNFTPCLN